MNSAVILVAVDPPATSLTFLGFSGKLSSCLGPPDLRG